MFKRIIKIILILNFYNLFFSCASNHSINSRVINVPQLMNENSQFDYQDFTSAVEKALSGQDKLLQTIIYENKKILFEKLKDGQCCLSKAQKIQAGIYYSGTCYQKKGPLKTYRRAVFCIYAKNNVLWDAIFAFSKADSNTFKIAFIKRPKGFNKCVPIHCKE